MLKLLFWEKSKRHYTEKDFVDDLFEIKKESCGGKIKIRFHKCATGYDLVRGSATFEHNGNSLTYSYDGNRGFYLTNVKTDRVGYDWLRIQDVVQYYMANAHFPSICQALIDRGATHTKEYPYITTTLEI